MHSRGYARVRYRDLFAQADEHPAAMQERYPRKLDVLVALFSRMLARLEKSADDCDGSFTALLAAHARSIAANARVATLLFAQDIDLPATVSKPIVKRRTAYTKRFIDAYKSGIREGRYVDKGAAQTVFLLIGAANSLYRWYRPDGDLSPDQVAQFAISILSKGYEVGKQSCELKRSGMAWSR